MVSDSTSTSRFHGSEIAFLTLEEMKSAEMVLMLDTLAGVVNSLYSKGIIIASKRQIIKVCLHSVK